MSEPFSKAYKIAIEIYYMLFLKILFLERGEGRDKERERNIDVQEIHQLVDSCTPSTGDLALNPGMCPDWESNQQCFGSQAGTQPMSHTSQGYTWISYMYLIYYVNISCS